MATPARQNITIYQGQTFNDLELVLRNPAPPEGDGLPIDLTGLKARMQVRRKITDAAPVLSASTADGRITITPAQGKIAFNIPAAVTAALPTGNKPRQWVYDIELFDDGVTPETATRIMQGSVKVIPEVTR
jgi:hypothetical protein